MNVAVLDDYQGVARGLADWNSLGEKVYVRFFHDHVEEEDELVQRLEQFEIIAIMRERTPFPRSLIEKLPRLKLIVTTGKRNASVDLDACKARGITVCGTDAGASGASTVELTWGLIIAVARGIPKEDLGLRHGRWQIAIGAALRGKTLGVLGLGRLGSQVAGIGHAFGMHVIAWSQNLTAERAKDAGAELVTKQQLFKRADVVTIHLVLSDRTRRIVSHEELGWMKPTAFLVNTSRGPIVDTPALIEALYSEKIAGAGIDVYDREPLAHDDPILHAPNTVLTPHLGYVSDESYKSFYRETVEDIAAWLKDKPIRMVE
jgi:phosphoglycerate dehydrogenase-like enzyme